MYLDLSISLTKISLKFQPLHEFLTIWFQLFRWQILSTWRDSDLQFQITQQVSILLKESIFGTQIKNASRKIYTLCKNPAGKLKAKWKRYPSLFQPTRCPLNQALDTGKMYRQSFGLPKDTFDLVTKLLIRSECFSITNSTGRHSEWSGLFWIHSLCKPFIRLLCLLCLIIKAYWLQCKWLLYQFHMIP